MPRKVDLPLPPPKLLLLAAAAAAAAAAATAAAVIVAITDKSLDYPLLHLAIASKLHRIKKSYVLQGRIQVFMKAGVQPSKKGSYNVPFYYFPKH